MPYESYDAWKLASPPDPPEETHEECWARCAYREPCQMVWDTAARAFGAYGAVGELPERMQCGERCGFFEEA